MRTNIEVNDELMAAAKRKTGLSTKREVVDLALRRLVEAADPTLVGMLGLVGQIEFAADFDPKSLYPIRELPADKP